MLTRLFKARSSPPISQRLVQALSQDARAGYTPIAFGQLATGWTLQIGQVPYDWHRRTATLYRNGSPLVTDFQSAECTPRPEAPGVWALKGILCGKPFRWGIHSSSLDRRWPYFESNKRVHEFWSICFALETRRHPDWGRKAIIPLGEMADEIHGLKFHGAAQLLDNQYLVTTCLFESKRLATIWLDPGKPYEEPESGSLPEFIEGAMNATPREAVAVRDYFWKFLVDEANRFADLHSTRWAVRQGPT